MSMISAGHAATGPTLSKPRVRLALALLLLPPLLCATAHARGAKVSKESIEYRGRARAYHLYVPPKLDTSRPAPLVFVLHGSGGEGRALVEKWRGLADEEGLIVVGPDSLDRVRWSIPEDGPDLLRDIAGAVGSKHPVDFRRVYLFGHSAGANSALPLGLFESEFFAAVAAHAGGMRPERYGLADYARRKIPFAFVVGTDDALALSVARATHEELARRGFAPLMHEVPGHDHNYSARASKINRHVWDFFKRHALAGEPRYVQYNWGPAAATAEEDAGGPGASPTLMSRRLPHEMGSTYLYEVADRTGARVRAGAPAQDKGARHAREGLCPLAQNLRLGALR